MDWATVFLGLIAVASLVQAGLLVALAVSGRRLAQRIDLLQQRLDRELAPALASFARVSRNLEEISDLAVIQARRVDDLLADTLEKIEDATARVQRLLLRPLGPLADLMAFVRGIKKGVEVYRRFGSLGDEPRRGRARRDDAEDGHLFI